MKPFLNSITGDVFSSNYKKCLHCSPASSTYVLLLFFRKELLKSFSFQRTQDLLIAIVLIKAFYVVCINIGVGTGHALFNRTRNKACMNDNLGFVVCKQTTRAVKNKHHIKLDSLK